MHGYDIIDHSLLNPEIGTQQDFDDLIRVMDEFGMGLVLDIVPNHMGVGTDNAWWMDVLEHGRLSNYADYFDIDWNSLKNELQGRVLLPVLGSQYGTCLSKGELQVGFNREKGMFSLHYYEHFWPISPDTYPQILEHRLSVLEARLGAHHMDYLEYRSIVRAFNRLPSPLVSGRTDLIDERIRESTIAKRRLAELCARMPDVADFIDETLRDFNQVEGNTTNVNRLHRLLDAQVYRLAHWRVASDEINYRRFFEVNELAGLRVEDARVFWDTHHFILRLIEQRKVKGLRIDHPDGLYDPRQYFEMLQKEVGLLLHPDETPFEDPATQDLPIYLVVEKILATYEYLPDNWWVHGTTGYDFAQTVGGVFVDQSNEAAITSAYHQFIDKWEEFHELVYQCKRLIMRVSLASELNVLAHKLSDIAEADWESRDFTLNNLRHALAEVVACFPVYRTYVRPGTVTKKDQEYIDWAIHRAKQKSLATDPSIFNFIRNVLLLEADGDSDRKAAIHHFAMKFQQYTGPVMAKGMEDTSFYRYNRLLSLNEVGGEPHQFGLSVNAFHYQNQQRARYYPHTMLTSTTHDTKRSQDLRARICVLSEIPDVWKDAIQQWKWQNLPFKTQINDKVAPDANDEYLIYQTLLGIWPSESPDEATKQSLCERIIEYVTKAMREAKVHTSWINPNETYEQAMRQFVQAILFRPENKAFMESFVSLFKQIAWPGYLNAMGQTALRLTVPGMPDIYQGCEVWDFSLVDPDNRRPVDYPTRMTMLDSLEPHLTLDAQWSDERQTMLDSLFESIEDGRLKLFVTSTILRFRQVFNELFKLGDYKLIDIQGQFAEHVIAFARCYNGMLMIVVVPRLFIKLLSNPTVNQLPVGVKLWQDTQLLLPEEFAGNQMTDLFTRKTVSLREVCLVGDVLEDFPVSVLVSHLTNKPEQEQL